ncbi:MAG: ATP-binding protein [Lishizhenia sp.]
MKEGFELFGTLELSATLENLSKVEALVDKVCVDLDVNSDLYGNVLIAVTEAFNNAVAHGSVSGKLDNVIVNVFSTEDKLLVHVLDNGKGFDFNNLPDPTSPENIEKENGRGIFLMKNLADEVEFLNNGSQVCLLFNHN